ncbi:MAG: ThuA domain-containing protein [Bacteroidota bacterium]
MDRRKFLNKTVLTGSGVLLGGRLNAATLLSTGGLLEEKNVLFVWGGWEGHDPGPCKDLFVPWMKKEGAVVTSSDTLDIYTDEALMQKQDLIVQVWTMGKITKDQEQGLLNAVKNGAGLAGWHGGLGDSFRENVEYQFMVGGQWVAHPGGVIDYKVNITDKSDPVTKEIPDFAMHSEQYYMHVDPNVKVLATTTFSDEHASWIKGCVIPVLWKKTYGKGRVFYSSLGHKVTDFEVPEALETMQRGIIWASKSKYEPAYDWVKPIYPIEA